MFLGSNSFKWPASQTVFFFFFRTMKKKNHTNDTKVTSELTNQRGEELRGGTSSSHKRSPSYILAELQVL